MMPSVTVPKSRLAKQRYQRHFKERETSYCVENLSYEAGSAYKGERRPTKGPNELSDSRRAHSPGSGS